MNANASTKVAKRNSRYSLPWSTVHPGSDGSFALISVSESFVRALMGTSAREGNARPRQAQSPARASVREHQALRFEAVPERGHALQHLVAVADERVLFDRAVEVQLLQLLLRVLRVLRLQAIVPGQEGQRQPRPRA